MRKLTRTCVVGIPFCAAILAAACANPAPPRGAPPDSEAPELLRTEPESAAVNVDARDVEFVFDEVVSERPSGVTELAGLFLISPDVGQPRVNWRRRSLIVRPRGGWMPNTTYTVTLLPGVVDLQNNTTRTGSSIVFSTGDSIHSARITGIVFDWIQERVAVRAVVQALPVLPELPGSEPRRDTAVYSAVTDSTGGFSINNLPRGTFEVRAFIDNNSNRALEPAIEKYDTARVVLGDSASVELLAFQHDSLPPSMEEITVRDTFTVFVRLNRPVDPGQTIDTSHFRILAASDSAPVPIVLARASRPFERTAIPGDSARQDSLRRADSLARVQRGDTTSRTPQQAVVPGRPAPPTSFIIQVGRALSPGSTYILRTLGIRGIAGVSVDTLSRTFQVPPARDTLPVVRLKPGR